MTRMFDASVQRDCGALTWTGQQYGRSVQGVSLDAWLPESDDVPLLVFAAIRGNEPTVWGLSLTTGRLAATPMLPEPLVIVVAGAVGLLARTWIGEGT